MIKQVLGLLFWFGLVFIAASIGAIGSMSAGDFYQTIEQPVWAPPGWLFGPVWTLLYVLMAIAAFLVWRAAPWRQTWPTLTLFVIHLVVNALWSWLFFAWRMGAVAFIEVLLLWSMIALLILLFSRFSKVAGWLLVPYWLWVTFATLLNFSIWQLNPMVL